MGIFEVLFDTVILCSLTALSILTAVSDTSAFSGGMALVLYAFGSTLGDGARILLFALVFSFAYATVLCWYYYGVRSFAFLTGGRYVYCFLPVFVLFIVLGSFVGSGIIVYLTDISILALAFLTVYAVIKKSDRIVILSELGGVIDRRNIKGSVFSRERELKEPLTSRRGRPRS